MWNRARDKNKQINLGAWFIFRSQQALSNKNCILPRLSLAYVWPSCKRTQRPSTMLQVQRHNPILGCFIFPVFYQHYLLCFASPATYIFVNKPFWVHGFWSTILSGNPDTISVASASQVCNLPANGWSFFFFLLLISSAESVICAIVGVNTPYFPVSDCGSTHSL